MSASSAERSRAYRARQCGHSDAGRALRRAKLAAAVEALTAHTPALPNAACRGRPHLHDPQREGEHRADTYARWVQAVNVCQTCCELTRCRQWAISLEGRHRIYGVVGGEIKDEKDQIETEGTTACLTTQPGHREIATSSTALPSPQLEASRPKGPWGEG